MNNVMKPQRVSGRHFHKADDHSNVWVAEISDLAHDDAHGGFRISHILHVENIDGSGVVEFKLDREDRDAEGEVTGWCYFQILGNPQRKLLIIND